MAATEASLTWGGLAEMPWSVESMGTMTARLQAMTWAAQAKDVALQDLQRRLEAALQEAEHGRARESALQRRVEIAEQAEDALAWQMGQLEAEAFTHITENNKLLAAYQQDARTSERMEMLHVKPITPSQLSNQVGELQKQLQAALNDSNASAQRCKALEEEAEQGRAREAALERRVKKAEEAEEALASEMAELEAEAFTRITENNRLSAAVKGQDLQVGSSSLEQRTEIHPEPILMVELQRQLARTEATLVAVQTELRQSQEKSHALELSLAQQEAHQQQITLKTKQGGGEAGSDALLSLSLQEIAGFVKLKLWNPSSLTLTSPS